MHGAGFPATEEGRGASASFVASVFSFSALISGEGLISLLLICKVHLFESCPGRCLDAAHGVAARTIRIVQRTVLGFGDAKAGSVVVAVGIGGRSPAPRTDAGIPQGSRRTGAAARSRRE